MKKNYFITKDCRKEVIKNSAKTKTMQDKHMPKQRAKMKKDHKGLFFKVVFTSDKALGQGHYHFRAHVKPSLHGFCVGVSQAPISVTPSPKGFTLRS